MIPPSEWLPHIWGETGEAEFPDEKAAADAIGAVLTLTTRSLTRSSARFVSGPIDLLQALRPEAWSRLLDQADEETRATMIFLMALQNIYTGHSKFTDDEIDEIDLEAPDLIPNCVATILHQARPELSPRLPK